MEQKQEKEETVPKQFDSFYSAVNAKMKTSNNKHVIDLILSSPTIRLSQSENIILDNRDIKESIVDFVCALKRQNTDFPDIYIPFWKQLKFHLNLLSTRMTKRKTEKLGSFLKSEKVSLNRLYSRGRAIFVRGVGLGLTHTENFMIKKLREVRETSGLELDQEEAEPTIGKNFKTGFEIPNENILIREHPYSWIDGKFFGLKSLILQFGSKSRRLDVPHPIFTYQDIIYKIWSTNQTFPKASSFF